MTRRIIAWVLLLGFVLLLMNLILFRIAATYSAMVYVAIIIIYVLFSPDRKGKFEEQELSIPYGEGELSFSLYRENVLKVLTKKETRTASAGSKEVTSALKKPVESQGLEKILNPDDKIVIIIADTAFQESLKLALIALIEEIKAVGCELHALTVIFGKNKHGKSNEAEFQKIFEDKRFDGIRIVHFHLEDMAVMGKTADGLELEIFSEVARATRRICIGIIEYDNSIGYSGGADAILPGMASEKTINIFRERLANMDAEPGNLDGNPGRKLIDNVYSCVPIDFILNLVLDEKQNILKAFAGHYKEAHKAGCQYLDELYKIKIPRKADIVIASAGGTGGFNELNTVQKALKNARNAVRDGGVIILAAFCSEGLNEASFGKWLQAKKISVYLVSELESDKVKKMHMEPYENMDKAIETAFDKLGQESKVIIMPHGSVTLPVV